MLLLQKGMKPFLESLPAFSGAPWLSAQTDDSFGRVYVSGPGNCGCRTKSFAIDISSVVPRVPAAPGGTLYARGMPPFMYYGACVRLFPSAFPSDDKVSV